MAACRLFEKMGSIHVPAPEWPQDYGSLVRDAAKNMTNSHRNGEDEAMEKR